MPHLSEGWQRALEWMDWALAVVWCVRTRSLMNRLGDVPDLSEPRWDLCPVPAQGLVVVVPAKDEAETIRAAMETLLAQEYDWLKIVAVDDRSTDATGSILEELAASKPGGLDVIHLTETAEGWLGKTFAMEVAASRSRSEWILFTDADVWFSPSLLRRALAYAELSGADHLVIAPTPVLRKRSEHFLLGFLTVFAVWASRPWRIADPTAKWDVVGAGAFNLIRRDAWEELGGFAPQRLAVVEDLTLGRRVRAAGMRQRLAFAPGLMLLHWATGATGIIQGMTKNLFAAMNFRIWLAGAFALFVTVFFLVPLAGLGWARTLIPSLVVVACIAVHYRTMGEITGIDARWGWLYPLGGLALLWAMLRSVVVTLWRGGVRWRDSFYPLRALRQHNSPFVWEWEAARLRAERRKAERIARPSRWLELVQRAKRSRARTPADDRDRSDARRSR